MSENSTKFRVAAVQAAPVFLDRQGTVAKACRFIEEAGANGARLVAFPEVFIPGYPHWVRNTPPFQCQKFTKQLVLQSVRIPSDTTEALGAAARKAGIYAVVGVNERDSHSTGTIYNTNILFDPQGRIMGRHRKLMPTYAEKLVWAPGDALGFRVYDTEIGKLGTLICGENANPLSRFYLIAEGEQVHVASYPPGMMRHPGGFDLAKEIAIRTAAHSFEGKVFSVVSSAIFDQTIVDALGATDDNKALLEGGNNPHTTVYGPQGTPVAGPLEPDYEGILYADIDLDDLIAHKLRHDVATSNYNRFDILSVVMRRQSLEAVRSLDTPETEASLPIQELKRRISLVRASLERGDTAEAQATLDELYRALQGI